MRANARIVSIVVAANLSPVMAAAPALAQTASEAAPQLEEIVVTAQKRAESLLDVPISIAAFSAEMLKDMGATDLKSIDGRIANVVFDTGDLSSIQRVSIRGITSLARTVGQETGFGVYVDGVFMGRAEAYNQMLPDIESVEVLRGPQGTIFGKNTIAGAMNLTTRRPTATLEGSVSVDVGNNDTQLASGYVSGPLVDGLAYGKISGSYGHSDGYATDVWNNSAQGSYDYYQGRAQLKMTPSERLALLLTGDYYARSYVPYISEITASATGWGVIPGDYTTDDYIAVKNKVSDTRYWGVSLQADYGLPSDFELTSITAYRESGWGPNYQDNAGIGMDIFYTMYQNNSSYLSEELRLSSPIGEKYDYIVGAYYSDQSSDAYTPFILGTAFPIPQLAGATFYTDPEVDTTTYAVFTHGNYHLNDRWTLVAGLRYTKEDKHADFYQQGIAGFIPSIGPLSENQNDSHWSPTAGIEYHMSGDSMGYFRVTEGYKSGGFNADNISSADNFQFGPESVWNYEIGLKTEFLDHRARINAAVFYMDYTDLQVTQFDSATSSNYIDNAASATSQGLELELFALPTTGLQIDAALGLLDATYDQFTDALGQNLSGNDLPLAPHVTATLGTQYTIPVGGTLDLQMRGEVNYRGDMEGDPENSPTSKLDAYTVVNLRLGLLGPKFDVTLWGMNVFDERYALTRLTAPKLVLGYVETRVQYAPPRTYGLSATYHF
ncbi:MAG: TonB-dependent receptor [Steroidobacteraceae bacterium]